MKKTTTLLVFIIALLSPLVQAQVSADAALNSLKEGNKRFVEGKSIKPHQDLQRIKEVSSGQKPFAIIVGCSDSRVPNEIIFDQGLGDLFIIRTAGQVSTFASWGSIEFGNAVLGANLIVVLGHTKCGAVSAACQIPDVPGHIVTLINAIKPAAQLAKTQKGDEVENAVRINVAMQVQQLENLEPVLTKAVQNKNLKIVGAVYNLETGTVEFLDANYLQTLKK
jgi:carbonic anhydrase